MCEEAAALSRMLSWRELIFARQKLVVLAELPQLDPADRITPMLAVLGDAPRFGDLWVEHPDSDAGKPLLVRVRTQAIINEPVITVQISVGCAGAVRRSYTLLADLPETVERPTRQDLRRWPTRAESTAPLPTPVASTKTALPSTAEDYAGAPPSKKAQRRTPKAANSGPVRSKRWVGLTPAPIAAPAPEPIEPQVPVPVPAPATIAPPPVAAPAPAPAKTQSRLVVEPLNEAPKAAPAAPTVPATPTPTPTPTVAPDVSPPLPPPPPAAGR